MPKRNVAFIKPDEPDFLKRMKAQIGYREGPSIDDKVSNLFHLAQLSALAVSAETNLEAIENFDSDSDDEENEDEKPQVVVVKEGDLTEAEAAQAFKEESEKPADLNQKIVFKARKAKSDKPEEKPKPKPEEKKAKKAKQKQEKSKLSFNDEEDEEEY